LRWVNHADVVLASNSHPEFAAVGSEECLVRRPADIDLSFYLDPASFHREANVRGHVFTGARVNPAGSALT
jgi:hypothetical protein